MTIEARREYLKAIRLRYKNSTRGQRSRILDEFCEVCDYNRKHAIRILGRQDTDGKASKPGPKPRYGSETITHLVSLWKLMNYMCSVRMKVALPLWLNYYTPEDLQADTRLKLLEISSSSIDRLLKPYKEGCKRGLSGTKSGAFLKSQIPIELLDKHVDRPGFMECDTVAHCGNTLVGSFANSLTMTDLLSGWTANRATMGKEAVDIVEKVKDIRAGLPFRMAGFAADNGSEFINRSLVSYLQDNKHGHVKFVRRRPYKKNDNAHVEQKNNTHVRQLFGYHRIEHMELIDLMNDIYRNYWNPLLNFFCPALKLIKKVRIGGKLKKTYDKPKTPYDRLIDSGKLTELQLHRLRSERDLLDPLVLKRGLDAKLRLFGERLHRLQKGNIKSGPGEAA
jgi:hypothetical protein